MTDDWTVTAKRLAQGILVFMVSVAGAAVSAPLAGSAVGKSAAPVTTCSARAVADPAKSERRLRATRGTVWVLLQSEARPAIRVGKLVKVVWRVTGHGPVFLTARGPRGKVKRLAFGPERHMASSWNRPGDEYGSGFVPDKSGCWSMTIRRGGVGATLRLAVRD
jgi:hypothetical protein